MLEAGGGGGGSGRPLDCAALGAAMVLIMIWKPRGIANSR